MDDRPKLHSVQAEQPTQAFRPAATHTHWRWSMPRTDAREARRVDASALLLASDKPMVGRGRHCCYAHSADIDAGRSAASAHALSRLRCDTAALSHSNERRRRSFGDEVCAALNTRWGSAPTMSQPSSAVPPCALLLSFSPYLVHDLHLFDVC